MTIRTRAKLDEALRRVLVDAIADEPQEDNAGAVRDVYGGAFVTIAVGTSRDVDTRRLPGPRYRHGVVRVGVRS